MKLKTWLPLALVLTVSLAAQAQPIITNFTTSIYATVTDPLEISFGADGALYVSEFNSDLIRRIAPAQGPRLEIARAGDQVSLAWSTATDQTYQLQSMTNLLPTAWLDFGSPFNGTGGLMATNVPIGPEPAKFFRLRIAE